MNYFEPGLLNYALLGVVLINAVLGLLILLRSNLNRVSVAYLLVIGSVLVWTIFSIIERSVAQETSLEWVRLLYLAGISVGISFLYFAMVFPDEKSTPKWELLLMSGTGIALGWYAFSTDAIVRAVSITDEGIKEYLFGSGYWIYVGYLMVFFLIGFWILGARLRQSQGIRKLQIKYVFIGYLLTALLGVATDLILPWIGMYDFLSPGPVFTVIMVGFTYYTMLRHNLLQTRVVVVKTILYALLIMAVTGFFAISILYVGRDLQEEGNVSELVVILITSFLIVIVLDPLKQLLARATDSVFYKDKIDYQALLRKVADTISRQVSQEGLVYSISKHLALRMKIEYTRIYVRTTDNSECRVLGSKQEGIPLSNPLVTYLMQMKDTIVAEELERIRDDTNDKKEKQLIADVVVMLRAMNASLATPMLSDQELIGILILGQRRSGDIYSKEEINFLEVIAPQIATALTKARLYDEAQQFNVKLKQEIDKATKELRVANRRLKQLDQAKSEFLSIAAHQLRTPLTGIKGYLSMFLEGDFGKIPESQRVELEKIFKSSDRLTRLIDVFLNVSRIETGRLDLKRVKVRLAEILDGVIAEIEQQAKAKGLELTIQKLADDLPDMYLDQDKIHDVMMNLVDNAIKYTPKGWVNVRLARSKSLITFEVSDSGIGIADDEIDKLFHKFSRAEAVSRIHTGGSGLGLFIAKKIIEAHGGRIWAESPGEGKGSKFTFTLPIQTTNIEEEGE